MKTSLTAVIAGCVLATGAFAAPLAGTRASFDIPPMTPPHGRTLADIPPMTPPHGRVLADIPPMTPPHAA